MRPRHVLFFLFTILIGTTHAQEEDPQGGAKATERDDRAAAFSAMLKNATLNGTWAPIDKRFLGDNQEDKYDIVGARKIAGNKWNIVTRMNFQGRDVEFPIPVVIEFAGDTAIMILNDVPVGPGQTWSARILFHDDVYAGSWWGADKAKKSGIVSGTITRKENS